MAVTLYPVPRTLRHDDAFDLDNVIAASAEGYAFPTTLDRDQPIGGLAPQPQADLVRQALAEDWPDSRLQQVLDEHTVRRRTDDI